MKAYDITELIAELNSDNVQYTNKIYNLISQSKNSRPFKVIRNYTNEKRARV